MPAVTRADAGPTLVRDWVQTWVNACDEFRQWERAELILKRPLAETVAEHGRKIRFFILTARFLQGMMTDADGLARQFRPEVDGRLLQLEATLQMIHDPMPDPEAEAILKTAFGNGR